MKQQNADTNNDKDQNAIYSHMAGRWCLRRPLDLIVIEKTLHHNDSMLVISFPLCIRLDTVMIGV